MSLTNPLTAEAATRTAPTSSQAMTLIGIFTAPDSAHILLRTARGGILRLEQGTAEAGLTLMDTGDGWALISDGTAIHRLVIA